MTIDELLATKNLTEEEWELHKDLIEECRRNEALIADTSAATRANLERMGDILDNISTQMVNLSVALTKVMGEAEDISLRLLPEHKFYRE